MRRKRFFGFFLSGLLVVTVLSSVGNAQLRNRQPLLRWMGQGFGDGYHQCNRGPNSDYYNPYSAHNSQLQSTTNPYGPQSSIHYQLQPSQVNRDIFAAGNSALIYNDLQTLSGEVIEGSKNTFRPAQSQFVPTPQPTNRLNADSNNPVIRNGDGALLNDSRGRVGNGSIGASPKRAISQAGFRYRPNPANRSTNRFSAFRN